jgi:hypothetical protein
MTLTEDLQAGVQQPINDAIAAAVDEVSRLQRIAVALVTETDAAIVVRDAVLVQRAEAETQRDGLTAEILTLTTQRDAVAESREALITDVAARTDVLAALSVALEDIEQRAAALRAQLAPPA